MKKLDKLKRRYNRLLSKVFDAEWRLTSALPVDDEVLRIKVEKETVMRIYELMTGEFKPYIDEKIAVEIAIRFDVYPFEPFE